MKTYGRLSAGLALACALALGAAAAPAAAAVSWDPESLTTEYVPTGPPDADGLRLYYAYAPSAIRSGSETRVWTCHNSVSGVIEDDIFATTLSGGSVVADASALTRSASGWDSFHICDPSVIRVDATYGGTAYRYAMFYLGNDQDASAHNQVGVAYATSLDGPWVKNPTPVIAFSGSDTGAWGAGQPSATTVDPEAGTAVLFWTEGYGDTITYRALVDLDEPGGPVVGPRLPVTTSGLTSTTGGTDWLNNADFAYDPSRDRFYVVREQHPYPTDSPDYIGSSVQVASIPGASVWGGGGTWTVEAEIDPGLTGYARNHNAGILRSEYGTLIDAQSLTVLFTTSCGGCTDSLWQYRLHSVTGAID